MDSPVPSPEESYYKQLRIPVWGLFIFACMAVLYIGRPFLVPVFMAILISFVMTPLVNGLRRWYIPRPVGSALILLLTSAMLLIAANYLADPVQVWFKRLPTEMRMLEYKLSGVRDSLKDVQKTTEKVAEMTVVEEEQKTETTIVVKESTTFEWLLSSTQELVVSFLTFFVLLYFLLAFGYFTDAASQLLLARYQLST
ncbi:MAG: AI-2E family transporter [Thiolinea sp.]